MTVTNRVELQAVLYTDSTSNATESFNTNSDFTFSIEGTFTGKIALQRSFNEGATWKNVIEYDEEVERNCAVIGDNVSFRFACSEVGTGGVIIRARN